MLRSYAIVFFSQNRVFGLLLLSASFFNPQAGLCGLCGVLLSLVVTGWLNFHRESRLMGFYSFNALLFGIGFGTFYQFNTAFIPWLIAGCFFVTMLSVSLASFFARHNFPLLSIPFVVGFWLLLLSGNNGAHPGLEQKSAQVLNQIFSTRNGTSYTLPWTNSIIAVPGYFCLFFRALSAVIFQNSLIGGIIISIGLLIHSRIQFSLTVLTYLIVCLITKLTMIYPGGISYYDLGANLMMASSAVGCFFLIPSGRSYIWALITIPISILIISGLRGVSGHFDLPLLSLPFCLVTTMFTSFFRLRAQPGKLVLTPLQHYSPERNLYQYLNAEERLKELKYLKLSLPFMGSWHVSQGYDGDITHKDGWGKALDFVITDDELKTYKLPGTDLSHFYCFNKPVLACADGTIEEVVDHIDDNPVGAVNTTDNWGNSIVIKHAEGLYSQVSHLKKNSAKVKKGDFVKQGDVIGMCGNSGRSPEPHLHFQIQVTAAIGSKTIAYPFAIYLERYSGKNRLCNFETPAEGALISSIPVNKPIKQAFNLQPGYLAKLSSPGREDEELEVFTDAWNQSYIYCKTSGATAYFVKNGASFYFTSYYGSEKSLLFYFYLAAYKIVFTGDPDIEVSDSFPPNVFINKISLWLNDFVAPFKQLIKLAYRNTFTTTGQEITIHSSQSKKTPNGSREIMDASLVISNSGIKSFNINLSGTKTEIQWTSESVY